MSFYVRLEFMLGRAAYNELALWTLRSGVNDVEYFSGGWVDNSLMNIAPHLKFKREEDAVAYVLANGGEYSKGVPVVNPDT